MILAEKVANRFTVIYTWHNIFA